MFHIQYFHFGFKFGELFFPKKFPRFNQQVFKRKMERMERKRRKKGKQVQATPFDQKKIQDIIALKEGRVRKHVKFNLQKKKILF
jgi:hypothetical protein